MAAQVPVAVDSASIWLLMESSQKVGAIQGDASTCSQAGDASAPGQVAEGIGQGQDACANHGCNCMEGCMIPPRPGICSRHCRSRAGEVRQHYSCS